LKKIGNGYNYTGYTTDSATTLATIDGGLTPGLAAGYFLAKWDRTTFTWQYYIHGFTYNPTVTVQRYNVILSKINANQVWII
jgi:hypothetical protein